MARRPAVRPLADLIGASLGETARMRGFAGIEVMAHWPEIVGGELASASEPLRLVWPPREDPDGRGATLMVRVEGTHALDLQFAAPVIVERINRHFGWNCVARLSIRQGPVTPRAQRRRTDRSPDPDSVAAERARLPVFADDALAESLARLAAMIRRERR